MTNDLAAAVAWALEHEVGAIVLAAEPPVFCAGGSVDDLLEPRADLPDMYAGFLALADAPVLTVSGAGNRAMTTLTRHGWQPRQACGAERSSSTDSPGMGEARPQRARERGLSRSAASASRR